MRRKKPEWLKVVVKGKYPDRPLTETEAIAVAMGFIQCQFTETEKVVWCDRSKRMSQAEFAKVWPSAIAYCDDQQKQFPGAILWPEEVYSDTPFVTGQVL